MCKIIPHNPEVICRENTYDPSYLFAFCTGARAVDGGGGSPGEPGHLPPLQRQEEPTAPASLQVPSLRLPCRRFTVGALAGPVLTVFSANLDPTC
jgi:hypothetical protein